MSWGIVYVLEGVSIGVLMMFHFINFKHGTLLRSDTVAPRVAKISKDQVHWFTDSEIDAADRNSDAFLGSEGGADIDQVGSSDSEED